MNTPIKSSDVIFHGRDARGLSTFTCYAYGLGQYRTDTRNRREAAKQARDYFIRLARAGGGTR
ncbi:MAG: hypothetical protein Q7R41_20090 [Phycisphaerales bacterium]|nr:hypothetical protein [Phycisphaerales bacterium]